MEQHLDVTNDTVFQRIFGKVGNEEITRHFLEKVLGIEIKSLSLDLNKRLIGEEIDDKIGRLDVRAKLSDGTNVLIEMQVAKYKYIAERILYYWGKIYVGGLKKGITYEKLHKTIVVLISAGELMQTKGIEEYHTKWHIREDKYSEKELTPKLEIHIIELSKFKKGMKEPDSDWVEFILGGSMGRKEDFEKEVQEAIEELERLEKNPEMQDILWYKEKALFDRVSERAESERIGMERGMKKGMKKGIKKRNRTTEV